MQSTPQRIWEGRLHLGDEPGVYGDAAYAGLIVEFPVTLRRFAVGQPEGEQLFEVIVEAQDVKVFPGYDGHLVTVLGWTANPDLEREWQSRVLGQGRLARNAAAVEVKGELPADITIRVQVDTDVGPGLYDDFVLRRVSLRSTTHHGALGFRAR